MLPAEAAGGVDVRNSTTRGHLELACSGDEIEEILRATVLTRLRRHRQRCVVLI